MELTVERLSFSFPERPVLEDVSCTAWPGRLTAVQSPHAAGQPPLLR